MVAKLERYAEELEIHVEQGSTFQGQLTWKDENESPIDLTGFTARMQLRNVDDDTLIHELTTAGGDITLGGAAGTIDLLISDTDSAAFTFDCAKYDLEVISGGGVVTKLVYGNVILHTEVTV